MTWSVEVVPRAEGEIAEATDWYEARRAGLGRRFLDDIDGVLGAIAERPMRFPRWQEDARYQRALFPRFPYVVFFATESASRIVTVVAVAHTSRRPGYWK